MRNEVTHTNIFALPVVITLTNHDSIYDLIVAQPTSRQEFHQNIESSINKTAIADLLASLAPILLASDGGSVPGWGSLGWVFQVGNHIIARGKGPAYGPDPRSFWAEGYIMWAVDCCSCDY
jgi:hypothetical protein